jgi:hypothetical protein
MGDAGMVDIYDIIDYLWSQAQTAADAVEQDGYSLALRTVGAARRGATNPFSEAVIACFGCTLDKHIERRAARKEFYASEMRQVASNRAKEAAARAAAARSMHGMRTPGEEIDVRLPLESERPTPSGLSSKDTDDGLAVDVT